MAKAGARRASDDKLERLQAFVDSIVVEADEIDHASLPAEKIREGQRRLIAAARTLASEDIEKRHQGPRTFHDVYMAIRSRPQPDLRTFDDLMGSAAEASGFKAPALVDHQDEDGFVYITTETIKPCTPCSGTGEIIEYPPDDDERMVACPACGGTGEAITL